MPRPKRCAACGAPWPQDRATCWACGVGPDWLPAPVAVPSVLAPPLAPGTIRPAGIVSAAGRQVLSPTPEALEACVRPCLRCGSPAPVFMDHCRSCGEPLLVQDPLRNHPLPHGWKLDRLADGSVRIGPPRAIAPVAAGVFLLFYSLRFYRVLARLLMPTAAFWGVAARHPSIRALDSAEKAIALFVLLVFGLALGLLLYWLGVGRVEWRVEGAGGLAIRKWYFGFWKTTRCRPTAVIVSPSPQRVTRRPGWAVQVVADGALHVIHWQALRSETLFYTGAFLARLMGVPLEDHGSRDV